MSTPSWQSTSEEPAQVTTFPLETMTKEQRQVFRQYLDARHETGWGLHEPIWLALLLACERPAVGLLTLSKPPISLTLDPPITAEEVIETFDLVYKRHTNVAIDVARTAWRFDFLPTNGKMREETAAHSRRIGCFYGYPEVDVEHYLTADPPDTPSTDLVANGIFQAEEVAYTTYLPQRHNDSIEGYKRAIASGEHIREMITVLADTWELPELEMWTERRYQEAVTDCLPEETDSSAAEVSVDDLRTASMMIITTIGERFEEVTVKGRLLGRAPEHPPVAEIGSLTIGLEGETETALTPACGAVQDLLDEMGLQWNRYERVDRRDEGTAHWYAAIVTEALTEEHIKRSPVEESLNR